MEKIEKTEELSDIVLFLSFFDENKAPVVATALTYRIDDKISGTEIKANTPVTPQATTYDLAVASNDNRILDDSHPWEERVVTMTYTYGSGKQRTKEFSYGVINLKYLRP